MTYASPNQFMASLMPDKSTKPPPPYPTNAGMQYQGPPPPV